MTYEMDHMISSVFKNNTNYAHKCYNAKLIAIGSLSSGLFYRKKMKERKVGKEGDS